MNKSRLASGLLVSMVVSGALVALPAVSATAAPTDCPTAFPTADAVDGVTGTGYTVERGTTPDPFQATILGRITDGIEPGVDLIIADLSSPALTRAGGVWEGMSGSPVYASDGRLIGSVSYGLADTSTIAGITPAADMEQLLTNPVSAAAKSKLKPASKIKVSSTVAKRLTKTGDASTKVASAGFESLLVPVSVSGVPKGGKNFLKDLKKIPGVAVHSGGARASTAAASPSDITAGSNFAAVLSYGDISIAGVGTTTFVCDGKAVVFGHPFNDLGDVQYGASAADAVYVQPDIISPFKVANPGGPAGVVDLDKTVGLRAQLGAPLTTAFTVSTSLRPDGAAAVTGTTIGVDQPEAGDISALHLQAAIIKALGDEGPGSAGLTFTIKGARENGAPFTLVHADHYADTSDVSYAAADELYSLVSTLTEQQFDNLKITSVRVTGTVSKTVKEYRVTALKVKKKGKWVTQKGTLTVKAGKTIPTRLTLTQDRSYTTINVPLTIKVPTRTQKDSGELLITDGYSAGFGNSAPGEDAEDASPLPDPTSLTGLLKQLASYPPSDSVAGALSLDGRKTVSTLTLKRTAGPVDSYSKTLRIRVS